MKKSKKRSTSSKGAHNKHPLANSKPGGDRSPGQSANGAFGARRMAKKASH